MRKFEYAPGLPGYGTRGVDGSTGLNGLATYFCAYDGTTDSITIKAKIIANKILFPTDELLPGYPSRVYQSGDQFVDRNGKVFKIDFGEVNLYVNTGQQLNTSGFFEQGTNTVNTPIYSRYSNAYTSSKFLIDVVYAAVPPGNYTSNPNRTDGSIYGIGAVDFAQVKYVNNPINGYQPFTIYTSSVNTLEPEKAIAIVKENAYNAWHIGNLRGTVARDVSLFLDFKDLYVKDLGARVAESQLLYINPASGRIVQGPAPSGMTMNNFGVNRVLTADTSTVINAEANMTFTGSLLTIIGDSSVSGNLNIGTNITANGNFTANGNLNIGNAADIGGSIQIDGSVKLGNNIFSSGSNITFLSPASYTFDSSLNVNRLLSVDALLVNTSSLTFLNTSTKTTQGKILYIDDQTGKVYKGSAATTNEILEGTDTSSFVTPAGLSVRSGDMFKKCVSIGVWNMAGSLSVILNQGYVGVDFNKIVNINVTIKNDNENSLESFIANTNSLLADTSKGGDWYLFHQSTGDVSTLNTLTLFQADSNSRFANAAHNSTTINRGFVVIDYF